MKRAVADDQPTYQAGETPEHLRDVDPTRRREQCTSCPFEVGPDGMIRRRTES
jgi:hypothetical protein